MTPPRLRGWLGLALLPLAACATLPDTDDLIARHAGQQARFESARGVLSQRESAALLKRLQVGQGPTDILDKQLALEQSISDSPLVTGNRVTLLVDGAATYPAMVAAIRAATDHVNLESYIIEDDAVGREFADLLIEQQRRGVQVNILYDSVGALQTPAAFFERLRAEGIAVLEFNPVNPLAARAPWALNHRDHRKLLIVDGRTVFLGGINISSVYSSGSILRRSERAGRSTLAWRDTDLQIDGPVVAQYQQMFLQTWQRQHGPPLRERNYLPALVPRGEDIVRAIGSTPGDPFSLIYLTLVAAIGHAEREICLTQAYFVPDPQLLQALVDAARRGVAVRMVLPGRLDSNLVLQAGRSHYARLLDAGVRLYERRGAMLHAKTVVVDGVWSTVGSANLDWRSFLDNDEVNAVVVGRGLGRQMAAMCDADVAASTAIDAPSWSRRSPMQRAKEWGARLLERLL